MHMLERDRVDKNNPPTGFQDLRAGASNARRGWDLINPLFALAFVTDLITPFLIWRGLLPAPLRWISHASLAVAMFGAYIRMMAFNQFPAVAWLIAWVSAVGISVAFFRGQSALATAWGWWTMFQYPLVGLFAYLQPGWPERYPKRLLDLCVAVLALQAIVQLGQYMTGQPPGDSLAGTFGPKGTGNLMLYIAFVLCLALGHWLAHWKGSALVIVLALGSVSSILGEMKLFPVSTLLLAGMAGAILIAQGVRPWRLIPYAALLLLTLAIFANWYNAVVPGAEETPMQRYLQEPETLNDYLSRVSRTVAEEGRYYFDIGRNYALVYAWETLRSDTTVLLFGLGLGARGESRTLGTAGTALLGGRLGLSAGTSLLVMIQELGLVGMATIAGFIVWVAAALLRDIKNYRQSEALALRYALLLFTLLWPLWLWYNAAWTLRVPMLLYWTTLGYVFNEARGHNSATITGTQIIQRLHS